MIYYLSYADHVDSDLVSAIEYYLNVHPNRAPSHLLDLAQSAFETAQRFPEIMPIRPFGNTEVVYRRVIVWHFIFLYRVDHARKTLVIERIVHDRSSNS